MVRTKRGFAHVGLSGPIALIAAIAPRQSAKRLLQLGALAALLVGGGVLAGCKPDAQLSKQEVEQFKQGPPREMPAEARQILERQRGGQGAPTGAAAPSNASQPPPAARQNPNGPR